MESEKTVKNIVFKQFDSGNDSDMDYQDEYQGESDVLLPISQDAHRLFVNHDDGEIEKDFLPRIILNNQYKVNKPNSLNQCPIILKLLFYKFREKFLTYFLQEFANTSEDFKKCTRLVIVISSLVLFNILLLCHINVSGYQSKLNGSIKNITFELRVST